MPNKNYLRGTQFERDVRDRLRSVGFFVQRAPKSQFPDGVALRKFNNVLPKQFLFECKIRKYISKEEKNKADMIKLQTGLPFYVFYKENHKIRWYEYVKNT